MIVPWDPRYASGVIALWNKEAVQIGYKELTDASFRRIFTDNPYFDSHCTFVWLENGAVKGFACGCTGDDLPLGKVAGYLTCIVLAAELSTEAAYKAMLEAVEQRFRELGKTQSEILFFNPMHLPWYIPDTPGHEHNNAPGVPVDSKLYPFLLGQGYRERTRECAMYLPLAGFVIPEDVRMKEAKAEQEGYRVEWYDRNKHGGVGEMLAALGNPLWEREIGQCTREGVPVVIAAYQGNAVGFAGPVVRQDNGRGYFAGIGVHPAHEGHGLGTVLFFRLCEALRKVGAEYMSLYTGSTNPARRIYEKAGFRAVREFAVMRKEFGQG